LHRPKYKDTMDDTPDKLRRNIVALAAAILAITFFNLSFKPTGNLLGFAEVGNVSPFKVWVALALTLLYIFLRYHFDEKTTKERGAARRELERFVREATERSVASEVRRHIAGQRLWFRLLRVESLAQFGEEKFRRLRNGVPIPVEVVATVITGDGRVPPLPWGASVQVNVVHLYRDDNTKTRRRGEPERAAGSALNATLGQRTMVSLVACLRALYSRSCVDVAVPYALGAAAAMACLFKLAFYFAR
jgi:hypothetical protein